MIVLAFIIITLNFVSGYFGERVGLYIKNKVSVYSVNVIEDSLRSEVINRIDMENLLIINTDHNDVVKDVHINTAQVNEILAGVNKSVTKSMNDLTEDSLELPLGIIFSDTLFGDLGPDFSILIVPIGRAVTDIVTEVSPYGINSSLLEVSIKVKINMETLIPLRKELVELDFNIPLVIEIINSDVPLFYVNSKLL